MSISPVLKFLPLESSPQPLGKSRAGAGPALPNSGTAATAETSNLGNTRSAAAGAQDVVKVQMEPPGETAVYEFMNQQGTLILQVPPQSELNLARQISQELTQEAATIQGEKNHGH